jgi:hypothetical protein
MGITFTSSRKNRRLFKVYLLGAIFHPLKYLVEEASSKLDEWSHRFIQDTLGTLEDVFNQILVDILGCYISGPYYINSLLNYPVTSVEPYLRAKILKSIWLKKRFSSHFWMALRWR